ncbi:hypothetical protein COHA_000042 [Chlorella ohadii]|uniref:Uncharacterized protein n=1 Tax=Chlorella ohadii TaxID=2649997 RepID=A0AAD5E1L3_9CHLO|nr:hypothetical protein COHA_000042 [Chlorella ohadii]
MTDLQGAQAAGQCAPSGPTPPGAPAAGQRPPSKSASRKSVLESLKSRVDGSSSDAASDAGSLGGETERELAPSSSAPCPDSDATPPFSWRGLLSFCGSGLLMSVAYLDPGNLEADIQAGAKTGFALLWWFALVSLACGTAFQCLSGRLGLVTGKDLAAHCGERWPRGAAWFLWVMLELAIVAVDIQETVGCAQALYMLSNGTLPLWAGCIVVSCSAFVLLLLERRGARWLEALFGVVIGVEAVAMAVNFFRAGVPAKEVALGLFRPTLPAGAIGPMLGALGALVMPYNLYFHSAVVNSRRPEPPTPGQLRGVLRYLRIETPVVLLGAFLINLCVICVFAQGFYGTACWAASAFALHRAIPCPANQKHPAMLSSKDPRPIHPADQEIGLQAAGDLLAERFGQQFKVFWAVGLLAAGQVSTIALTYAGQLVMSGLLQLQVKGWARMIGTRLFALAPALTVAIVSNANNKFDGLNQMLNIVQSIQLPFALIPAIHMAGSAAIMGPPGAFATRRWLHLFCSLVALTVVSINGYFLVIFRRDNLPAGAGVSVGWGFLMAAYYLALGYYALGPDRLAARFGPHLRRMRSSASSAASSAGSAAGVAVQWVKRINWKEPDRQLELLEIHL